MTRAQKKRVKAALKFSWLAENIEKMDYDAIVTDAALRKMFGYDIPEGKVKLKWLQSKKKTPAAGSDFFMRQHPAFRVAAAYSLVYLP